MRLDGLQATFLPADPYRNGRFVLWSPTGPAPDLPGERRTVSLVLDEPDDPDGPRRRRLPAILLPPSAAVRFLLDPPAGTEPGEAMTAWRHAVLAGLRVLGRGRLLPAASPAGHACWRAGPLDEDDAGWLRRASAALPPAAFAAPLRPRGTLLHRPEALISACWDALADALARETDVPDAPPELAAAPALPAGPLGPFLDRVAREASSGVRLVLRVAPPPEPDGAFRGELAVRGAADAGLSVDLAALWSDPAVLDLLGPAAEDDLLVTLRRAARGFPPLAAALGQAAPESVELADGDVADLLDGGTDRLAAAGVDVLWPAELAAGPKLAATTRRPAPTAGPAFTLDQLLEFDWHATLDGARLTDAEVATLADAKRPLIRMRGRWIRVDAAMVDRLRRRRAPRLTGARALAAALTGSLPLEPAAGSDTAERVEFRPDPALAALADRLAALGAATATMPEPAGLAATLRPYQRRGLRWLAGMCESGLGGCLADDMGLGKTIQVVALHLHRRAAGAGPTLVVCPTSLLGNWERELARFAPGIPVRRFHGARRELSTVAADEVVLASYGVLRRDTARLAAVDWGLVVADEAQHAKNPLSSTARALRALPTAARVALTGTPVENRLTDLWSILDWTTPGLLGPLAEFRHRVAIPVERYGDAEATDRFARLVRPFLLRRRKSDDGIAPDLPPKTETDRLVPLTAEQVTLYQAVVDETMARIEAADGIGRRGLVLGLLTALKQVCNHPAQYLGQAGPLPGRSGKLAALDELLDVILAERESVLVFSQYVGMCRLLEDHLAARGVPTLFLHGGVPVRRREERVAAFQDGAAPVFLLSLKSAGTGLNLTRASHVVHYDRWWNPAVEDQATDRAHRIGATRPVQVHRLTTENTVEDRVATLIAEKRALADAVVGTGERWLTELSDTDLRDLVTLGAAP